MRTVPALPPARTPASSCRELTSLGYVMAARRRRIVGSNKRRLSRRLFFWVGLFRVIETNLSVSRIQGDLATQSSARSRSAGTAHQENVISDFRSKRNEGDYRTI